MSGFEKDCADCPNPGVCDRRRRCEWGEVHRLVAAGPAEFDPVNSPSHYVIDAGRSGMVECKDVVLALTAMGMPHYAASAFEYLWRAGRKDDLLVDLKKARRDLDMQIEHIEDSRREASE